MTSLEGQSLNAAALASYTVTLTQLSVLGYVHAATRRTPAHIFIEQILEAVWYLLAMHLAAGIGRAGFAIDRRPTQKCQPPEISRGWFTMPASSR